MDGVVAQWGECFNRTCRGKEFEFPLFTDSHDSGTEGIAHIIGASIIGRAIVLVPAMGFLVKVPLMLASLGGDCLYASLSPVCLSNK